MAHAPRRRRKLAVADLPALYDYLEPPESRCGPGRPALADDWRPVVTDDWPELIPITEAELDLFETYFGDLIDDLFGPKIH